MKRKDLTGMRFSRLTVIGYSHSYKRQRIWRCKCDCGNEAFVSSNSLLQKNTQSCGCLQKEKAAQTGRAMLTKHGLSRSNRKKTRLFRIWIGMKTRCNNVNDRAYPKYGGRGIRICEEWSDFMKFHDWAIANGYSDSLSIDRINVDGNYEPANCRWATPKKQANNRTNNHIITFNGKSKTMSEFASEYGIPTACLNNRLKSGWNIERALLTKPNK